MNFEEKIKEIQNATSKECKMNIHFTSLRNFIFHYMEVKKEKIRITQLLEKYIELIETKNYCFTKEECRAAYNLFIYQLGMKYYRRYLGFSSCLTIDLVILTAVIPNILFWLFFHSIIANAIAALFTTYRLVNYFIKIARKKVYGYRY